MKKLMYVVWLVIAIVLGFLIAVLNSELITLSFLLGPIGIAAVAILLALFIISIYKIWTRRGIWFNQQPNEKNI